MTKEKPLQGMTAQPKNVEQSRTWTRAALTLDAGSRPSPQHLRAILASASLTFSLVTVILGLATGAWSQSATIATGMTIFIFAVYSFRFAWICFTAALTMSGISYQLFGLTVLPEQVLLTILVVHAVRSQLAIAARPARRHKAVSRTRLVVAGLLVVCWLLVLTAFSAFSAPSPSQSLRLVIWVFVNVLAVFVVRCLAQNPALLIKDALKTTNVMLIVFIIGWLAANLSSSINIFVEADYASSTYRLKGLMLEPNLLAALSLTWLCIGFVYRASIGNGLYWSSLAIMSFGIFMTYTRAAWLILLALIVCTLWTTFKAHRGLVVSGCLVVLPFIGFFVFDEATGSTGSIADTIQARFSSILDFETGTGAYRARTWEIAWQDIVRDGWWSGHGYNSFSQSHFSSETSNGTLYLGLLWLSLIYDGGLLSFLLFVSSLFLLWKSSLPHSAWFYVAFIVLSTSTNPTWFMFPWVLAALLIAPRAPQGSVELAQGKSASVFG